MKKILMIILISITLSLSISCHNEVEADIYTTIYPLEFVTKEIVGDKLTVASVYPRGKDIHDYEPQPKKIISILESDVLFYVGLGLEPFIENALDSTFKDLRTVKTSSAENLTLLGYGEDDHDEKESHNHSSTDPHFWLYPLSLVPIVDLILSELIKLYPDYSTAFIDNANTIKVNLLEIDQEYRTFLESDSITDKTIIVVHDAYRYWGHFYGIERIKINPDMGSAETGSALLQNNLSLAKEKNIKHICANKNTVLADLVKTYQRELSAEVIYLHPLESISNNEFDSGENYYTIMRDNLATLEKALTKKE